MIRLFLVFLVFAPLLACAPLPGMGDTPGTETVKALDGVKLISTDISRGDDPRSFGQRNYTISSSSRLLVRYEALSTAAPRILEAQPMYIRVTPASDSEKAKALTSLKICPVLTNWMMAATWQFAHPFKGGGWHPGGDVEFDDCISVDTTVTANPSLGTAASAPLTIGDDCKDSAVVCFNIQPWFKNYLIQRGINYGLVLVTLDNSSISIYGNGSGSRGPRIHWADGP